jgi:glycerate 2-kinase
VSTEELRKTAWTIIRAALVAADPQAAVVRTIAADTGGFTAAGKRFEVRGRLLLAAVGKAAAAMTRGALSVLGGRIDGGIVVLPHGYPADLGGKEAAARIEVTASGHPVPDGAGLDAARRVLGLVESMDERDTLLVLLSGGGSSLLPLPAPSISLDDKVRTTRLLLECGADIREINTVRKHLSAIKGGRLAERARGSIATLAVSDVVGDSLQFIASGPTVPDSTSWADARCVLVRRGLLGAVPPSVLRLVEEGLAGKAPDTPKSIPDRHAAAVIASNGCALDAAATEAAARGFAPVVLTRALTGEAREAGRALAAAARAIMDGKGAAAPPACLLAGGETTVTIRGSGTGGRNQELALAAAVELQGLPGLLVASFATDGKEGNTDAAGAFASGHTVADGRAAGLDPSACLAANDSHRFLAAAGDLIVTGPTGTNVNDITLALVTEPPAR